MADQERNVNDVSLAWWLLLAVLFIFLVATCLNRTAFKPTTPGYPIVSPPPPTTKNVPALPRSVRSEPYTRHTSLYQFDPQDGGSIRRYPTPSSPALSSGRPVSPVSYGASADSENGENVYVVNPRAGRIRKYPAAPSLGSADVGLERFQQNVCPPNMQLNSAKTLCEGYRYSCRAGFKLEWQQNSNGEMVPICYNPGLSLYPETPIQDYVSVAPALVSEFFEHSQPAPGFWPNSRGVCPFGTELDDSGLQCVGQVETCPPGFRLFHSDGQSWCSPPEVGPDSPGGPGTGALEAFPAIVNGLSYPAVPFP